MEIIAAVVDDTGVVRNIIIADENTPTESGTQLVPINANQFVDIGFTWDGQNFLDKDGNPVLYND